MKKTKQEKFLKQKQRGGKCTDTNENKRKKFFKSKKGTGEFR